MAGRPSEYKPEFLDIIIAVGEEGGSAVERCVAIGVSRATYYNWINPSSEYYNEDFHKAHEEAELRCEAWWEKAGRLGMVEVKDGPKLNGNIYRLHMQNRFGWSEKREETQTVTVKARVRIGGGDDE